MNKFLLLLTLSASNLFAQINMDSLTNIESGLELRNRVIYSAQDTIPIVLKQQKKKKSTVLYYLNGNRINEDILSIFDTNKIETISVESEKTEIDGITYDGKIFVTSKNQYEPKLITLEELKAKYCDVPDNVPSVFILDNTVINADPTTYQVDEKFIFQISVQHVEQGKSTPAVYVIILKRRTKENLDNSNKIILR